MRTKEENWKRRGGKNKNSKEALFQVIVWVRKKRDKRKERRERMTGRKKEPGMQTRKRKKGNRESNGEAM